VQSRSTMWVSPQRIILSAGYTLMQNRSFFFNPAPNSFHPTVSATAKRPTVVMSARCMTCGHVRFAFCNVTVQEGGITPKLSLLRNNRRAMFSCKKNLPMWSRSRGCRHWHGKPKREILISQRIYPHLRKMPSGVPR